MELINLQPRINQWRSLQKKQAKDVAELEQRSAALLERWYKISIMGGGECWAEWDSRITRMEQKIKRAESAKEREEKDL